MNKNNFVPAILKVKNIYGTIQLEWADNIHGELCQEMQQRYGFCTVMDDLVISIVLEEFNTSKSK